VKEEGGDHVGSSRDGDEREVVADAPTDWPDGTGVYIQPTDEVIGLPDDDRPPTQDEINRTLGLMDQV
jgi:hypothetical protein